MCHFQTFSVSEEDQSKWSRLLIEGPKKIFAEFLQRRDGIRPFACNSRNDSIREREGGSRRIWQQPVSCRSEKGRVGDRHKRRTWRVRQCQYCCSPVLGELCQINGT